MVYRFGGCTKGYSRIAFSIYFAFAFSDIVICSFFFFFLFSLPLPKKTPTIPPVG